MYCVPLHSAGPNTWGPETSTSVAEPQDASTSTKFGCGKAACGACTIHIDGEAVRSCSYAVKFAEGKIITTIEGLSSGDALHPVQQAWIEEVVPQCGYCQPGFMMATAAMLEKIPHPTDEEIDQNIVNVCRCATYYRMRKAIHRAAELNASTQ